MSLITRCPACGTMFKVVADQLKVSQGWVRCGHCSEIFDASLHLRAAAPPVAPQNHVSEERQWSPGASFADRSNPTPPAEAGSSITGEDSRRDFDPASWKQQLHASPLDESGTLRLNEQGQAVRAASPVPMASSVAQENANVEVGVVDSVFADAPSSDVPNDAPGDVSFVRDAQRKAFWRRPFVRFVIGVICLLLVALLALQGTIQQRDSLAALEPRLMPLLQTACEYLLCEIGPVRHIETIVIDSSSFSKAGNDSYRLGFSIKNTGAISVAMPSLEVTLTDTQDQPIVRRVLTPEQFGAAGQMLGAGSDFAGLVVVQLAATDASGVAAPLRVAGYRVLAFYP
ncbi:MAG: zinc-ribbon domain-containing protein [Polaromonas sp.]|nr:zinc-ribbon domain-containing protein [Polaromonas sp.]